MSNIQSKPAVFVHLQEEKWKDRYLDQLKNHIIYPEGFHWGRLICIWNEKTPEGKVLTHRYAACIDTKEWGLYLDCRPALIYAKCVLQCLVRPLHGVVKEIYHISMIPIFSEIAKLYLGITSRQQCLTNALKSLVDVVRTPLYTVALIAASIAVLIIGPIVPQVLYPARTMLGKIEKAANWGENHTEWTLASCFQPFPMTILENYDHKKCIVDSIYVSQDPLEIQLSDFACRRIQRMRKMSNNCFCIEMSWSKRAYVSSILI